MTFPPDWKERVKKRSSTMNITAKERQIMKALNTVLDVDFKKHSFQDVMDYLRRKTDVDFDVPKRQLEEVGASFESEITLSTKATVRSILKRILGDLNLAYVVKDEAIHIMTRERASQMTSARTYYVGDLLGLTDSRLPPLLNQMIMIQNLNSMVTTITQTIEPKSWQVNNPDAVGTIVFDPITMSFVVKQTAEIHFMMGGFR